MVAAVAACRGQVPEQAISPPTPRPEPVADTPGSWVLHPGSLAREYRVAQRARVTVTLDSVGPQADSTSIVVEASVRNVPPSGFSGLLRSATVVAFGAGPAAFSGIVFPYAFTSTDQRPGVQSSLTGRVVSADPCASPAQVPLGVVRDVFVHAPDSLSLGREWSDSGAFPACRDGVRLEVSSRRRFTVTGYERLAGAGVLHVTRTDSTLFRGLSVRGDDTTRVYGSGTSVLRYLLDATTGDVLSASGTGSLDIVVRGALKSQRAHQTNAVRVLLRAP